MIDANAPFKSPPRISRQAFKAIIERDAAPGVSDERDPGQYWDAIKTTGVDPLFLLAMFNHESTLGQFGMATKTHSWGNTRPPSFGVPQLGVINNFSSYRDWLDGCKSTAGRLVATQWVYANRTAIREIFDHPSGDVWAPAGDSNDPAGYLRAVLDFMNAHVEQETPLTGDDSRFAWTPDTSEWGYPQGQRGRNGVPIELICLHITAGTDSQSWLLGGHGSSTHYLTRQDGSPRAQHVAEADAAWTPGSRDYALRSINVEVEMLHTTDWTDAIMREVARTIAPIMQRHGIPAVYLGRDNGPGKRGMIGHRDVPSPDGSGYGGSSHHDDPGANFRWDLFTPMVAAQLVGGVVIPPDPSAARYFPETGHSLGGGFLAFWIANGGLPIFGYPLTEEREEGGLTTQYFERAVMEYHPLNTAPNDIQLRRLGAEALERQAA